MAMLDALLICGNALNIPLASESVQTVVTSPPYWGLRDYGKSAVSVWGGDVHCQHVWTTFKRTGLSGGTASNKVHVKGKGNFQIVDESEQAVCKKCGAWRGQLGLEPTPEMYTEHLVEVFREVRRVLKSDGTLWLNLGDSYAGSWGNYGAREGKQRSRIAERWHRSAYEDARRGWDGLPPTARAPGLKPKDLVGIPWRVAFALQADGWYLRQDIIWAKPNPMPESVKDRCTKAHEYIFLLAKSPRYYYNADAIRERVGVPTERAASFRHGGVYTGGQSFHNSARRGNETHGDGGRSLSLMGRNKRSVWTVATQPYGGAHFATFPPNLVEPMILAGSRPGDIVLDPFAGTSTVGKVALHWQRRFVGVELNPEYIALSLDRLTGVQIALVPAGPGCGAKARDEGN